MLDNDKIKIHKEFDGNIQFLLDGHILPDVKVGEIYPDSFGQQHYYLISKSLYSSDEISSLKLNELELARVKSINLKNWAQWEGFQISVGFGRDIKSLEDITFEVEFEPDLLNWKFPYSYNDYFKIFREVWNATYGSDYYETLYIGGNDDRFKPVVKAKLSDLSVAEEIEKNLEPFIEIHEKTLSQLKDEQFENSLLTLFIFPEELKVSCKQYLLYFATFLQDLVGIDATSNLKEEAGKVLFSVTPNDDIEGLDKIREALAVYLNLPSSPVLYNDSFQSMQLKQQVENLQHSQRMKEMEMRSAQYALRLAQQNIENQDKIITQQNSFIDNQNKIIEKITSKSIMIDSLENKEELEKFWEGFEVGKSEFLIKHFGLHLNPATVLKNAGRKILGKEESKSILGLDEETDDKGK